MEEILAFQKREFWIPPTLRVCIHSLHSLHSAYIVSSLKIYLMVLRPRGFWKRSSYKCEGRKFFSGKLLFKHLDVSTLHLAQIPWFFLTIELLDSVYASYFYCTFSIVYVSGFFLLLIWIIFLKTYWIIRTIAFICVW